ncbi:MAG: hypothetical protein ABI885_21470 [Gammaproteobacteria bacterium]
MHDQAIQSVNVVEWLSRYRDYFAARYPDVDIGVVNVCAADAADHGLCDKYPDHPEDAVEDEVASWTPHHA